MARSTGSSSTGDIPSSYPILVSTNNPDRKFVPSGNTFVVGRLSRDGYCYCIDDKSISFAHCIFFFRDNKWKLRDQSSSGTFVNRKMVFTHQEQILMDRDVIQFGYLPINTYTFYADWRDYEKTVEYTNIQFNMMKRKVAVLEEELLQKNRMIELLKTNVQTLKAKMDDVKRNSEEYIASISHIIEAEFKCAICCELLCEAVSLSCGHMICKLCFEGWKHNAEIPEDCPVCRVHIESDVTAYAVNSVLSAVIPKLSEDVKAARFKVLVDRGSNISDLDQLKPRIDEVDLTEEDSELPIVAAHNGSRFAAAAAFVE